MTKIQQFYSNGKLLITGEYLVLDGALALAIPTKFGQTLSIFQETEPGIHWTSYDYNGVAWFNTILSFNQILNNTKANDEKVNKLTEILHHAHFLNQNILSEKTAILVETSLTFPRLWGLGTSSTLINNLAQWFNIDSFDLLKKTFGGSGYDIACAKNDSPILYRLKVGQPKIKTITFSPTFKNNLYFVYLNQKQDSQLAVKAYFNKGVKVEKSIKKISKITKKILDNENFKSFCQLIDKHEVIMSNVLEQSTIKENLFSDFDGHIKSLGAWGGDFILVASEVNPLNYFRSRGFQTLLSWQDLVK